MKSTLLGLFLIGISTLAYAHDEGHGPKLSDTGKYGGLISSVVKKSDEKMGANATMVHKAELVRAADGTVRIYFYDTSLKPLDLKSFSPKGTATLETTIKGKQKEVGFTLELKDGNFIGKIPKPEGKPYNIDVHVNDGKQELLAAFDNLD